MDRKSIRKKTPKLAVTLGDPAGIGPEIVLKAFEEPRVHTWANLVVIGNQNLLETQAKLLGLSFCFCGPNASSSPRCIPIYDIPLPVPGSWEFGKVSAEVGKASLSYVETAVNLATAKEVQGIVTAPINKEAWNAARVPYLGHTEALASLFRSRCETMFVVDNLRVFFLTRHVSLRHAIELVKKERILELLEHVHTTLSTFGVPKPAIAVAALNPHGGEGGLFGEEEANELRPAIEVAKTQGIRAIGPIPADSVFHQGLEGYYDAIISLYHDQGHIATKTYDFYRTVSVTTGLPVIRTSVDHGTAFGIAGKGIANPTSMIEAVRVAAELATGRLSAKPTREMIDAD